MDGNRAMLAMYFLNCSADFWPVLLQHNSINNDLRVLSRLLCCNQELHAAVLKYSTGQLDMLITHPSFESAAAKSLGYQRYWDLTRWISKHGKLLRSLDVKGDWEPVAGHAEHTLEEALMKTAAAAAASTTGQRSAKLPLQSFGTSSRTPAAVLQLLSATTLTRLDFRPCEPLPEQHIRLLGQAVTQFGNLQKLTIQGNSSCFLAPFKDALCSLKHLRVLDIGKLQGQLTQLQDIIPENLQELHMSASERLPTAEGVQLSHLTALTRLQLSGQGQFVHLVPSDILPMNLVALDQVLVKNLQPILVLHKLQQLGLSVGGRAAQDLQPLTALTALTDMQLSYAGSASSTNRTTATWPLLPLTAMRVQRLNNNTLQHLSMLHELTSLYLAGHCSTTYERLAKALQQLTSLRCLNLHRLKCQRVKEIARRAQLCLDPPDDTSSSGGAITVGDNQSGGWQLMQAVAGHPLISISLAGLPSDYGMSLLPLQQSTKLTHLRLSDCQVPASSFNRLAQQLTGLQELDVNKEPGINDAAVAAISSNLTCLTRLAMTEVAVTFASFPDFLKLTSLLDLVVQAKTSPAAPDLDERVLQLSSLTSLTQLQLIVRRPSINLQSYNEPAVGPLIDQLRLLLPCCHLPRRS